MVKTLICDKTFEIVVSDGISASKSKSIMFLLATPQRASMRRMTSVDRRESKADAHVRSARERG